MEAVIKCATTVLAVTPVAATKAMCWRRMVSTAQVRQVAMNLLCTVDTSLNLQTLMNAH